MQSGNFLMILAFFATALKLDDKTVILVDDKEKETVKKVPTAKITLVHPEFFVVHFFTMGSCKNIVYLWL